MIVTSHPSLRTQIPLESDSSSFSKLGACGLAAECVGIPMLEECTGVGV